VPSPTRHRRLGRLPGRRLALIVAAGIGVPVLLTDAAIAYDGSAALVQATIYKSGGATATETVSVADLLADPSLCPTYSGGSIQEDGRQGELTVTPPTTSSWTVGTILQCLEDPGAGLDPIPAANVTAVTIIGDEGSPETGTYSELTPADLASPSDYLSSQQNPVVESLGSTDQYDRPQRQSPDLDFLDEAQTSPIAMDVFEGSPLTVTASASPTTVTVGSTIAFDASVTGNSASTLNYAWSFDGGAPGSSEAAPQIQFNTAGVWTVSLQVTDSDGGAGVAQLTVTVDAPGATTTPATTGSQATGPNTSHGNSPGATPGTNKTGTAGAGNRRHATTPASKTKTRTKTRTRTKIRTKIRTKTRTKSAAAQTQTQPAATTPAATTPALTTPATSPAATTPASTTPAATLPAATTPKPKPAPVHRSSPKPALTPPGALVRGLLISDVVPLPPDESPLVHVLAAPAASAPARQAPPSRTVLPIVGAVLAVMVLLGLGAGRELRGSRRGLMPRLGG
jgi:PKD domain